MGLAQSRCSKSLLSDVTEESSNRKDRVPNKPASKGTGHADRRKPKQKNGRAITICTEIKYSIPATRTGYSMF